MVKKNVFMVQREYIKNIKIFVFLIAVSCFGTSYASSWLPEAGKYKISSNVLLIDEASRIVQKERAAILSNAHKDISVLLKKQKLTKAEERDLQELESFVQDYESFNEEMFMGNDVEYGISKDQSFGLKANIGVEKNLRYKYTSSISEEFSKRNVVREIGVYYKRLLYRNDKWQISLVPEFIYSKNDTFGCKHSYILASYLGYSKILESGKKHFSELGFAVGRSTVYNNRKDIIFKKVSFAQGVELIRRLMIINYFEYSFATRGNLMYRDVIYEQISLAKEFGNTNNPLFTAQVGYYWKRNMRNKMFQLSGPIFSLCINL